MKYNYSKLLGRIKEYGYTKINGKFDFTAPEMDAICELLDIPNDEIGKYFFAK